MRKVTFRSLLTLLFLTTSSLLSSQEKPTVSVIPFTTENVSKPEASTITRLFEAALVKMNAFTVLEQSDADQILKAQEYSTANCTDEACAIEIGKLLSAQNIFIGTLAKIESTFYITVKLIDVKQGKNLRTESAQAATLSALTDKLKDVAEAMRGAGMTTAGKASIIAEEEGGESGSVTLSSAQASSSYVTFDSDPPAVAFTLYDNTGAFMTKAVTSKALRLSFGRVTVKAQDDAGLYYPFEDTLEVGADSPRKFTFKIQMKPNFGVVQIGSAPAGAEITKDGMRLGVTPFRIDRLKSGSHTFVLKAPFYDSKTVTVSVEDEKTARIDAVLDAAFVWLSVSEKGSLAGTVYVDGEKAGRLPLPRKQVAYRDFTLKVVPDDARYGEYGEKVKVKARGETIEKQVALAGRIGILNVETEPYSEGDVFLDGKKAGTAPESFNLLVGTYEVRVSGAITLTVPITSDRYVALAKAVKGAAGRMGPQSSTLDSTTLLDSLRTQVLADLPGTVDLMARIDAKDAGAHRRVDGPQGGGRPVAGGSEEAARRVGRVRLDLVGHRHGREADWAGIRGWRRRTLTPATMPLSPRPTPVTSMARCCYPAGTRRYVVMWAL